MSDYFDVDLWMSLPFLNISLNSSFFSWESVQLKNELLELSRAKRGCHRSEVSRGDEQLSTSGVLF